MVKLNGDLLKWENSVNHLGNMLDQMLKIVKILEKKGVFIRRFNKLLDNFGKMQSHVLVKLFQNCCSFYSSVLWKRDDGFFKNICTILSPYMLC